MKKCEVISYFTLKKFDELKNIVRANENNNTKDGELFVGDTFDCNEEMAKYLTGENDREMVVVKITENVEGAKDEENESKDEENSMNESYTEEKSKKKKHGKK